ncbi:MAG: hypothetical protein GC191_02975 [Azospirillum sp.]|nr:hypothetical protein [Azospirillum sp.]
MTCQVSYDDSGLQTINGVQPWQSPRLWDDLSKICLICLTLIVFLIFQDYGISTDEEVQNIYGQKLLAFYFSGFTDWSAFHYKDLYLYGGLFDLASALVVPISPFGEYETRHLLCGLIGVVGIAGCWRTARLLGGARAGFLAAALLALTAAWFGAMFNNTKDVPFAAAMIWGLYHVTRIAMQLPRPKRRSVLKLGLVVGLGLGIRVGALLIPAFLAAALFAWVALSVPRIGAAAALRLGGGAVLRLLPALPIAYALMAVLWPWSVFAPLNPVLALEEFSRFPIHISTLLDGRAVWSTDPPALYLPIYLGVKLSEPVLVGLVLAIGGATLWGWRQFRRGGQDARDTLVRHLPLILAGVLPVVIFTLLRPTVYNGIRHFMFVVPALTVMAALAFARFWQFSEARNRLLGRVFGIVLLVVGLSETWMMAALHPNQYVFYNLLAGGLAGAQNRYELDYWGNSLREATLRLTEYLELENGGQPVDKTYRVYVCGPQLAASYYMPPFLKLSKPWSGDVNDNDFFIYFTTDKGCAKLTRGREIIEVERFGVALSEVLDRRALTRHPPQVAEGLADPADRPAADPAASRPR